MLPAAEGDTEARPEALIEVKGLFKSFDGREVLSGVDLSVPEGSTTVILGGSGTGKSVLMRHLIGLERPDRGSVRVAGQELTEINKRQLIKLRELFGMVFQSAALFDSMTVFENVRFPVAEHRRDLSAAEQRERVEIELRRFGLFEARDRLPAQLSGGMRKRVGLARATILKPRIVLYDEPTTGLDPLTTRDVDDSILQAKRELGVTSVVISHDMQSALRIADQIAFLCQGQIVERGPPEAIRHSEHPVLRRFLGLD